MACIDALYVASVDAQFFLSSERRTAHEGDRFCEGANLSRDLVCECRLGPNVLPIFIVDFHLQVNLQDLRQNISVQKTKDRDLSSTYPA